MQIVVQCPDGQKDVAHIDAKTTKVTSKSRPGLLHVVDLDRQACDCEGFQYRRTCRHLFVAVIAREEASRRARAAREALEELFGPPPQQEQQVPVQSEPVIPLAEEGPVLPTSRITQVTYRRLHALGNYENETIEATATVDPGQDPDEVLAALKTWVRIQFSDPK